MEHFVRGVNRITPFCVMTDKPPVDWILLLILAACFTLAFFMMVGIVTIVTWLV